MTKNLPISMDAVPQSLLDIAEAFGMEVVQKLIEYFGGTDVKFPKHPADDHKVLKVLGVEEGRKLCFFLSGQKFYVPSNKNNGGKRRRAEALLAQNSTMDEVARELLVSTRQLRRIVNRPDPNQLNLPFDD